MNYFAKKDRFFDSHEIIVCGKKILTSFTDNNPVFAKTLVYFCRKKISSIAKKKQKKNCILVPKIKKSIFLSLKPFFFFSPLECIHIVSHYTESCLNPNVKISQMLTIPSDQPQRYRFSSIILRVRGNFWYERTSYNVYIYARYLSYLSAIFHNVRWYAQSYTIRQNYMRDQTIT